MAAIVRALRETSRQLGDVSRDTSTDGAPTMVVERPIGQPPAAAGPTVQVARTFVTPRAPVLHDPGVTVMQHEVPHEGSTRAAAAPPASHLGKGLAIAGAIAAVLVVVVATVVYLVRVPPPSVPAPAASAPAPATARPATAPPQVSATVPGGGLEIVPSRPPEPVSPPEPVAPPKPRPVPEARLTPAPPRPAASATPPARPATPAPKPAQPSVAVAKPAPDPASPNALRAQLEERLRSRGLLRGSGSDPNTGVTVEVGPNGVVTLRGIVRDATQRDEAASLVRLAGVSEVRLQVNVQSSWN
jgi:hypothetical protein